MIDNIDTALIVAGGEGTRLRPLTYEIPKPMVPVNGRPVLEHIIDELKRNGISKVYISVGYKAPSIIKHFEDYKVEGVNIECISETELLGTGGAIKQALSSMKLGENVLVLWGDNLFKFNLGDMYDVHAKENALITFGLVEVPDVTGYGVVEMRGNEIVRFLEKPDPKTVSSRIINGGIFLFRKEIMQKFPEQRKFSIERDFFEKVIGKEKICGYVIGSEWYPTDNMERYQRAIEIWKA